MRPQPELVVEEMPVDELVPYANNAKEHPQKQIDEIAESISEFGNCDPIGIWHNERGEAEIVEGHGRVLALKKLGIKTAPVISLDHLTDEQRRIYTHVHNQTTLSSGFDEATLIEDMDNLNADWGALGFQEFLPRLEEEQTLEEVDVPADVVCRCKPGEIWTLGQHRVMCGSATCADDVKRLVGGGLVDLYLTDPPYNVTLGQHMRPSELKQLHRRTDGLVIENDAWDDEDAFVAFLKSAFDNALGVMRPGAAFYIWHAHTESHAFFEACMCAGFEVRQCLVWAKNTFALGRQDYQWKHEPCLYGWKEGAAHYFKDARNLTTVFEDAYSANVEKMKKSELQALVKEILSDGVSTTVIHEDKPAASREHPTMKPIRLMGRLIQNSSRPGQTVLDSFGGSGSTLMACEQLGRKCLTMELDPHYCDVIIERWEMMTGEKAVREE